LATRIYEARGDEDDQLAFDVLFCVGAKETVDDRDVTPRC
jgi:hypothetical protein